ncbi:hypothetical protein C823_006337 [Eubacterium plexicaudatum ASF492]|uniref:Uncharacterized protein n=1 Tax=Eubacterium plexicaudatum ASF492 TaxID=1235802 RepID=N2AEB1_9FIRM|nr:hypothetical protein C823_006337 [Eubacterium plexicaudatum ASF492]
MNIEDIAQLLLSQQAIFIYEIIILAVLVISIILLSKKRKLRKQIQISAQQRQVKRSLDDSLANQRRR